MFSRTLEEHLQQVIQHISAAGLKLKPSKYHFIRREVEYLGHLITPHGLKTNPRLTSAVADFSPLTELRRFLGMSSYYRRFVPNFSKMASPLQSLTRKDAQFVWMDECARSFQTLKEKLTSAPVLSYPSFEKPFVLETDASIAGLGAVLSQSQEGAKPLNHRVGDPCSCLGNHFMPYLYGHDVTVLTDHTAVKAILQAPNPSGKHARWWTKVYASGVRNVKIQYRPGRLNSSADALSRSPQSSSADESANQDDPRVATVTTTTSGSAPDITTLLSADPANLAPGNFADKQHKDPDLLEIINFIQKEQLPREEKRARKIAL